MLFYMNHQLQSLLCFLLFKRTLDHLSMSEGSKQVLSHRAPPIFRQQCHPTLQVHQHTFLGRRVETIL